jgi:hypothetical protein
LTGQLVVHQILTAPTNWVAAAMQSITDWKLVQPPKPAKRIDWKKPFVFLPVSNIKSDVVGPYDDTFYFMWWDKRYNYNYNNYITGADLMYKYGNFTYPTRVPISVNSLKDGFTKLQPSFKDSKVNGINVYTAILELADLKKTFMKSTWALKKTFDDLPEKNLAINFGVLPLFGDIQQIYAIITKLGSYIDTWNEAAKGGLVWDKHVSLDSSDSSLNYPWTLCLNWTGYQAYRRGTARVSTSGKAHLYFKPKIISDADRRNVYYNALGLAEPLEGVWEAVPFSWAIDYFLRVGDFIADFDEALPTMFRYDFVAAGYSYKSKVDAVTIYEMRKTTSTSYVLKIPHEPFIRNTHTSEYQRYPVSYKGMMDAMSAPDDYSAGWNKGWRQASYLASVAYLLGFKR